MADGQSVILLADDNSAIRMLLDDVLSDEGYRTICCASEAEAITKLELARPDLAIFDLQMEHPTAGLSILNYMRRTQSQAHIPVIIYSANPLLLQNLAEQITSLRAVAFAKPFDIDSLIGLVRRLLSSSKARDREETSM